MLLFQIKLLKIPVCFLLLATLLFNTGNIQAQNSLLVNFGSGTCSNSLAPAYHILKDPLSESAVNLAGCDFKAQVPDFYNVFIAYNPSDNNIYIADNRTGDQTKIWRLDIGLPGRISCPVSTTITPDIATSYVSNNFEFDNNGDLWSFSAYDRTTGTARMDKFDLTNLEVVQSKVLRFPEGNFPTAITSGDLCILPNGRLFATLGSFPSRLYEITNYAEPDGEATAQFLTLMPQSCYGIAYVNGKLEVTGTNLSNVCYYFLYDISTGELGGMQLFQNGLAPIDNTSITPAIGATKQLLSVTKIEENSFFLSYDIYLANMGNTILNNIQLEEDLGKVFGKTNVSEVVVSFAPGGNPAGLKLNPGFDGINDLHLFEGGQQVKNQRNLNVDYNVRLIVSFRVSGLQPHKTYLNSAIVSAIINNDVESILVLDSSNNGNPLAIDPNRNGLANEAGENNPTPFAYGTLPVTFLGISARESNGANLISWSVATPVSNADYFEVEKMKDGGKWEIIQRLPITNNLQQQYVHRDMMTSPGQTCYRIKQLDKDGTVVYSQVACLSKHVQTGWTLSPNPSHGDFYLTGQPLPGNADRYELYDYAGRKVREGKLEAGRNTITARDMPAGSYHLVVHSAGKVTTFRLSKI